MARVVYIIVETYWDTTEIRGAYAEEEDAEAECKVLRKKNRAAYEVYKRVVR